MIADDRSLDRRLSRSSAEKSYFSQENIVEEDMTKARSADDPQPGKRMHRELLFPTPIYYTELARADTLNARLIEDINAWQAQDPHGIFRSNLPQLGGWHSTTDMHLRPRFTEITEEIFELMHGVFSDQGYDERFEPVCDSMWANINPPGAFNRHHSHPNALWSGVYYVHTHDDCGLLCITDPRSQAHVLTGHFDPTRRSPHSREDIHYQPHAGRLIVFPGWLVHSTNPNLAGSKNPEESEAETPLERQRISLGFNFRQRKKGIDPKNAAANEIVRADLLSRHDDGP